MTTNVQFRNNDFSFGISYKDGEAQTIQSWSSIDTWRRIFSNQESNSSSNNSCESILAEVTRLLVEITTKHSEIKTDYYSIGSTIHLQPLNKEINILPSLDETIKENLNEIEKKEVRELKNNIRSENEAEMDLTRYINNILIENNSIFHYILFGIKTENCLFYYKDLKINYNERKKFRTIRDLFEDLGGRLYYAGDIYSDFSALKLLRNKIKVVPRYVYATRTPENKKIEFLVAWKPNNQTISKGCYIEKNEDLLANGSFLPFHRFESYNLSKLNYENLRNYFQRENIILANEQRVQSKNFINLPEYITNKISGKPIRESIITLKLLFDGIYLPSLFYILPKNKFLNYMRTTYRWLNEYNKENQLEKAKKYLQCNMQMIINYDKDSKNILDCSRYELKGSAVLKSIYIETIDNLYSYSIENSESFINYINCFYEGYKKFQNIVNNFQNGSEIYYYDLDEYINDLNSNRLFDVNDYYKKGYIIDFDRTTVLIQNENEIKEFEFIKQPFLKFTNE
jgi:transcriptional regulator of heat shock response